MFSSYTVYRSVRRIVSVCCRVNYPPLRSHCTQCGFSAEQNKGLRCLLPRDLTHYYYFITVDNRRTHSSETVCIVTTKRSDGECKEVPLLHTFRTPFSRLVRRTGISFSFYCCKTFKFDPSVVWCNATRLRNGDQYPHRFGWCPTTVSWLV